MLVPVIFKLGRVSLKLQIWHLDFMHFFLPVMVGVVEILVLTSICLRLGGCLYIYIKRSVCAKRSNDSTKVRT